MILMSQILFVQFSPQGLNTGAPDASVIEDQNALALAIISTDGELLVGPFTCPLIFCQSGEGVIVFFFLLLTHFGSLYFQLILQRLVLVKQMITILQDGNLPW